MADQGEKTTKKEIDDLTLDKEVENLIKQVQEIPEITVAGLDYKSLILNAAR